MPVSPACCDTSQSRIASASCSAPAVVSTQNVMLAAKIRAKFVAGLYARLLNLYSLGDTLDRFREVLPLH